MWRFSPSPSCAFFTFSPASRRASASSLRRFHAPGAPPSASRRCGRASTSRGRARLHTPQPTRGHCGEQSCWAADEPYTLLSPGRGVNRCWSEAVILLAQNVHLHPSLQELGFRFSRLDTPVALDALVDAAIAHGLTSFVELSVLSPGTAIGYAFRTPAA